MSRWGKPRKNKKFIDPRYFMDEKMETLSEAPAVEHEGTCKETHPGETHGEWETPAAEKK